MHCVGCLKILPAMSLTNIVQSGFWPGNPAGDSLLVHTFLTNNCFYSGTPCRYKCLGPQKGLLSLLLKICYLLNSVNTNYTF